MTAAADAPTSTLPTNEVLQGRLVRLEPFDPSHVPLLKELAFAHPDAFRLTSTPSNELEATDYFGRAARQRAQGTGHPVAVVLLATGRVVGMSRLSEVDMRHRRCELGFSWYDPGLFRSGVNLESKLLLLRFAFERLGLHRVQLQTDTRNFRSQRAIEALGAELEGVLRRHQVAADGYVRDSLVYSITDLDWPEVRVHIGERLARKLRAP